MFGLRTRERAQTRGGDMSSLGGRAEFLAADFFSMTAAVPYDFIFDYTFLCAIPPSTRTLWAGVRVACARERHMRTLVLELGARAHVCEYG